MNNRSDCRPCEMIFATCVRNFGKISYGLSLSASTQHHLISEKASSSRGLVISVPPECSCLVLFYLLDRLPPFSPVPVSYTSLSFSENSLIIWKYHQKILDDKDHQQITSWTDLMSSHALRSCERSYISNHLLRYIETNSCSYAGAEMQKCILRNA